VKSAVSSGRAGSTTSRGELITFAAVAGGLALPLLATPAGAVQETDTVADGHRASAGGT